MLKASKGHPSITKSIQEASGKHLSDIHMIHSGLSIKLPLLSMLKSSGQFVDFAQSERRKISRKQKWRIARIVDFFGEEQTEVLRQASLVIKESVEGAGCC